MSRILDRLRRERANQPPASPDAAHTKVVLDTLSGRTRNRAWHPAVLVAALITVAGIAILYSARFGPPPRASERVMTRTPSRPSAVAARVDEGPQAGESEPSVPHAPLTRLPTRPGEAAATSPAAPALRRAMDSGVPALPASAPDARPPLPASPDDLASVESHFRRAIQYQRSGDVGNAVSQYKQVLERDPAHVEAHNNLGLLYQAMGAQGDAIREFSDAIRIDPGYVQARNNRGVALLQAGDVGAAIADFEAAIRADGRNAGAMVNLAIAERAARRPSQAQETLIRAIAVDRQNAAAHYNLASLYEAGGEFTTALEYYERYLTLADARDDAAQMADVRQRCTLLRQRVR